MICKYSERVRRKIIIPCTEVRDGEDFQLIYQSGQHYTCPQKRIGCAIYHYHKGLGGPLSLGNDTFWPQYARAGWKAEVTR